MLILKRNKLYLLRFLISVFAVATSLIINAVHTAPPCLYCLFSKYSLSLLSFFYFASNISIVQRVLPSFFLKNESFIETLLILLCFLAGIMAVLAKYGILFGWMNLCSQVTGFGCQMSYPFLGFVDLKILAFLGGVSLTVLKLADSFPLK